MYGIYLGLAMTLGAPALKEAPKKDPGIVGVWTVESTSLGGKAGIKPPAEMRYEFTADGKWTIHREGAGGIAKPVPRYIKLDTKSDPAKIDMLTPDAPAAGAPPVAGPAKGSNREMLGIYKIDGDTLTLCVSVGGERPTTFEPNDNGRLVLLVLKRVKKLGVS